MRNTINNLEPEYAEADYELQYRDLLFDVIENHVVRDNERTGVGCASRFSLDIDIDIFIDFICQILVVKSSENYFSSCLYKIAQTIKK